MENKLSKRIAIVGAGPAGLFMYKKIVESGRTDFEVHLFERKNTIGSGMPYSPEGAGIEHVTNISDNEVPDIATSITEWIQTIPGKTLDTFGIAAENFKANKVLPRLLFGHYLAEQFKSFLQTGAAAGIKTKLHLNANVVDIIDFPDQNEVGIEIEGKAVESFDAVIICSGHNWPSGHEHRIAGYYDSPYPPSKINGCFNHPVALRGSSLTAIDAIKSLARGNGSFSKDKEGKLLFTPGAESPHFRIVVHSRNGLLPAIRIHLDDPLISRTTLLSRQQILEHIEDNGGFLSLDFMFEKNFKDKIREKDPEFYERVKHMDMETFVDAMMALRERLEPFQLFRAEYAEALKSLRRKESVYWKEMLVVLSFAMNYPAKYLSAEDMLRYQKVLAPLIAIVIASVPQGSSEELLALNDAGLLDIVSVGDDSTVEASEEGGALYSYRDESGRLQQTHYKTFVDCVGQPQLFYKDLPFPSLVENEVVSQAYIRFKSRDQGKLQLENANREVVVFPSGEYYLKVRGLGINDNFQVLDPYGVPNDRIFIMAVPYIGGYNPDYSGLDFCDEASGKILSVLADAANNFNATTRGATQ